MTKDVELHRAVARIEAQIAMVVDMLKTGDGRHERTEKRVGAVERRQAWYSGAAAAVGAVAAYLIKH